MRVCDAYIGKEVYMPVHMGTEHKKKYKGKIVYIHPKFRFFDVEFQLKNGTVRESFKFDSFPVFNV